MATAGKHTPQDWSYEGLFINGEWVKPQSGELEDIINPATEEVIGRAPVGSTEECGKALEAARKAFDEGPWPRMDRFERAKRLEDLHEALSKRQAEIAEMVIAECGATRQFAPFHFMFPMQHFQNFIEISKRDPIKPLPFSTGGNMLGASMMVREPGGVVSAITPYNFPYLLNMMKIGPALAAGCTVVLKPSPYTPLQALIIGEVLQEVDLPEGVVNIVTGGVEVGQMLAGDPRSDIVTFTGSDAVAAKVMAAAAPSLKRVLLENGGKSALIICEGISVERVAQSVLGSTVGSAGQACMRTSRVLMPNSIMGDVADLVGELAKNVRIGNPADPETAMGPLIREVQRQKVADAVEVGHELGGTLVTGGRRPEALDRGFFYEPTVFSDVDNAWSICQDEIFGPFTVMMGYDTPDEAVAIANDSRYGLAGSIVSPNPGEAFQMALKIRTGMMSINGGAGAGINVDTPFGGYKRSGLGREWGEEGFNEYTEIKSISFHAG